MTLKQVIEALIFASPKPISTREIVAALRSAGQDTEDPFRVEYAKLKEPEIAATLTELENDYRENGHAYVLNEQISGWAFITVSAAAPWVRQLYPEAKPTRLSGPQLETLAIVAYRQPVTRADIEAVRGVAVDGVMQVLLDRSLIKIAGRAEVPGRPLLYRTTEYFLQHFGLKTTDELPNSGELKRVALPTAQVLAETARPKKGAAAESGEAAEAAETSAEPTAEPTAEPSAEAESAVEAAAEPAAESQPTSEEPTASTAPEAEPPIA